MSILLYSIEKLFVSFMLICLLLYTNILVQDRSSYACPRQYLSLTLYKKT